MATLAGVSLTVLVLVLVGIAAIAEAATAAGGDGLHTYIVQMSKQERPSVFTSKRSWYASTIVEVKDLHVSTGDDDARLEGLVHYYENVFHGFAARLTAAEVRTLESKPGVQMVYRDTVNHLHTTHTPDFLGIDTPMLVESGYGEDLIIGVIDSGVWPESKSFSDDQIGAIPSRWKGSCVQESSFNASSCNRKLIGAKYFVDGYEADNGPVTVNRSPRDNAGHGSHTASIAGGSFVPNASLLGYAPGTARGMAPKARIAVYKVCWDGRCTASDTLAAFDAAVADGVDVISVSLGSGPVPYFTDSIAIGSYGATKKGIFVACSGGNNGYSASTVTNIAPWITTVAASTVDRSFPSSVRLGNGASYNGQSAASGPAEVSNELFPIVWAANAGMEGSTNANFCLNGTLDPSKVTGKIVLCDRGQTLREVKAQVCKAAGAAGMVVRNLPAYGEELDADLYVLPGIWVGAVAGQMILDYVTNSPDPKASIFFENTSLGDKPAPQVATFSSRGPNPITPEILKPDVAAPGVTILAAWSTAANITNIPGDDRTADFNFNSGTSMACPHISGIAVLLKRAHPEWSPAAIKSAIMTTASRLDNTGNVIKDQFTGIEASPFAYGAGHVTPVKALDPGLVYDIEPSDYLEFLCASNFTDGEIRGIDPEFTSCSNISGKIGGPGDLNYPSISVLFSQSVNASGAAVSSTVSRTVTNVGSANSSYAANWVDPFGLAVEVSPSLLDFTAVGEKQSFTVSFTTIGGGVVSDDVPASFGYLVWSDGNHVVQSPLVATWLGSNIPVEFPSEATGTSSL